MAWHGNHRDNWLCNHIGTPGDCQDQYGVWAPGLHDPCWMNDAFNLYAIEVEQQYTEKEVAERWQCVD